MSTGGGSIRFAAVGITVGLAAAAAACGFVLLPMLQGDGRLQGVWDSICTAAGVVRAEPARSIVQPVVQTSQVVVTQQMMGEASAQSIGQGATLALRCAMCHGARGLSEAYSPNLRGSTPQWFTSSCKTTGREPAPAP